MHRCYRFVVNGLGLGALMASLAGTGALVGCASQPTTAALGESVALYDAQRFADAERDAAMLATRSSGLTRTQASYVAGLAAYRQGNHTSAERHLLNAIGSSDSQTAGRANAMLGIMAMEDERPVQAIAFFDRASEQLVGRQRDEASRYARKVRMGSESAGVHVSTTSPRTNSRFVLQAGAFRDLSRASKASQEIELMTRQAGLGDARVVQSRDDRGQPLYLVQFGGFYTRGEASRVRQSLGRLDFIVTSP